MICKRKKRVGKREGMCVCGVWRKKVLKKTRRFVLKCVCVGKCREIIIIIIIKDLKKKNKEKNKKKVTVCWWGIVWRVIEFIYCNFLICFLFPFCQLSLSLSLFSSPLIIILFVPFPFSSFSLSLFFFSFNFVILFLFYISHYSSSYKILTQPQ